MKDMKFDQEKPRMDLLPLDCMAEIAKILTFGAAKYKENSWQKLKNGKNRYRGALLRHLTVMEEEKYDKESKLLHAAHLACNAMFILWFEMQEVKNETRCLD